MYKKTKPRSVMELLNKNLSEREVAAILGCSRNTVSEIKELCRQQGMTWDDIQDMTDDGLYNILYPKKFKRTTNYVPVDYASLEDIGMFWEDLKNAEWDWFVGLLRECIRVTKKPFAIGRNYRYKNYVLGEKVSEVIKQYAEGSLTEEQERELRQAGFKFNRHIK